jgi:hypothetical protein
LNHGQSLCPRTFANKLYNTDELVKGTRPDAADLASMRFTLSKSVAAQQQTNSRILQGACSFSTSALHLAISFLQKVEMVLRSKRSLVFWACSM